MKVKQLNIDSDELTMHLEDLKRNILSEITRILDNKNHLQCRRWLRSRDVRRMLNISAGTLQNLRANGTLPYSKVSGIVFYEYHEITKLLEANKSTHQ